MSSSIRGYNRGGGYSGNNCGIVPVCPGAERMEPWLDIHSFRIAYESRSQPGNFFRNACPCIACSVSVGDEIHVQGKTLARLHEKRNFDGRLSRLESSQRMSWSLQSHARFAYVSPSVEGLGSLQGRRGSAVKGCENLGRECQQVGALMAQRRHGPTASDALMTDVECLPLHCSGPDRD
jgi:hypothetical protein